MINNSDGHLGPGIGIRAEGGYVVVPPSRHAEGITYLFTTEGNAEDVPAWLSELLISSDRHDTHGSVCDTGAVVAAKSGGVPSLSNGDASGSSRPLVRLADVLDEIEGTLNHFISLPNSRVSMLLACWVVLTYAYKAFEYCGYLSIKSGTPQCGKSKLLDLLALLSCGNPPVTTTPTAATVYRNNKQILFFDEVDQLRNADKETKGPLLAVLNTGFRKGSTIQRNERDANGNYVVRSLDAYGPKAFAGLEQLTDTLADRSFAIEMVRTARRTPRLNSRRFGEKAGRIRGDLEAWVNANRQVIEETYAALPDEMAELKGYDDRYQDIAEPLVVLAKLADAERPEGPLVLPRLLTALGIVARRMERPEVERELTTILDVVAVSFRDGEDETFIPSATLFSLCKETEALRNLVSEKALARLMKTMGQSSYSDGHRRGYRVNRQWVTEWQARYGRGRLADASSLRTDGSADTSGSTKACPGAAN
jgi:hypothetical protein